jgi:hypothetical protein
MIADPMRVAEQELFDEAVQRALASSDIKAATTGTFVDRTSLEQAVRGAKDEIGRSVSSELGRLQTVDQRLGALAENMLYPDPPPPGSLSSFLLGYERSALRPWLAIVAGAALLVGLVAISLGNLWLAALGFVGIAPAYVELITQVRVRGAASRRRSYEANPEIQTLQAERSAALASFQQALLEKGVLPFLRKEINERLARSYSLEMNVEQAPGLSELFDSAYEIPTDAIGKVERLIAQMPGGSIGISGPRGSGKSTLIGSLCRPASGGWASERVSEDRNRFEVMVAAPAEYVARDFFLYLFAVVCRKVLETTSSGESFPIRPLLAWWDTERGVRMRASAFLHDGIVAIGGAIAILAIGSLGVLIFGVPANARAGLDSYLAPGGAAIVFGLALVERSLQARRRAIREAIFAPEVEAPPSPFWPDVLFTAGLIVVALGVGLVGYELDPLMRSVLWALFGLGLGAAAYAHQRSSLRRTGEVAAALSRRFGGSSGAARIARERLRRIQFQQTFSAGWSGGLKVPGVFGSPVAVEAGVTRGRSATELVQTVPEIVHEFREFVESISSDSSGQKGRVIIGIDEVDKIESDERARAFLNDIKVIFGIPHCYYLVSLSEDALASFERRGMPLRDVFDSAFDEIVRVHYLRLADAKSLLYRRVVGLPVPFACLCYCLSGGLPRDLIRSARTMIDFAQTLGLKSLAVLTSALVRTELQRKTDAIVAAVKRVQLEPEVSQMLRWSTVLTATSTEGLLRQCIPSITVQTPVSAAKLSDEEVAARRSVVRLATELAVFAYYCATLLELFNDKLDRNRLQWAEAAASEPRSLDRLAECRQTFAINTPLAWERLSEFRNAWGMQVLALPTP